MSDGGMSDARLATIRLLCELDKNLQGSTVVERVQLRALIARLDAAERDAARYRWLRDSSVPPHNFYIATPDEFAGTRYRPQDVDAYIDAARAALTANHSEHGSGK